MLDHVKNHSGGLAQALELESQELTWMELNLIRLYRQLSEQDQLQMKRVIEALTTNPEAPAEG